MTDRNSEGVSIEMLPMPDTCYRIGGTDDQDAWDAEQVTAHAHAVAEHNVKKRDAELVELRSTIEALRAEVERLQAELDNRWAQGVHTCHDKCQRIACVLRRDNKRLAEAGSRVTAAFRALGETTAWTRAAEQARHECEAAMLALDDALDQEGENG